MSKSKQELVPTTSAQMVMASGVDVLLAQIRAEWQVKSLIARVKTLLPVDPSSACQRLLNAAIHDLREKIVIAGLDVAQDAASMNKLPPASKAEDVQNYSTTHTLDLAYHMGLINRPEWRRLKRAYDIRKDLEHEDDQYEAGIEDCVYVFRTCVEIVLSRDPISPVRVTDIKDIIESPTRVALSTEVVQDFGNAPDKRQLEIMNFLISVSRDGKKPDVVRQNAIEALRLLSASTRKSTRAETGQYMQDILKNRPADLADMKIASAARVIAYLKQSKVKQFFEDVHSQFVRVGYRWDRHDQHGRLLDDFEDVGGLEAIPVEIRARFVLWMVRCFLGEPGGYGMGINRSVFYSNVAAPRIEGYFRQAGRLIEADFNGVTKDRLVKAAASDKHIARRLEKLRDLVAAEALSE